MTVQILDSLNSDGKLKRLVQVGVVPIKIMVYYEMYHEFQRQKEELKKCRGCVVQAVTFTADKFRVSEKTVYKAIQKMQAE